MRGTDEPRFEASQVGKVFCCEIGLASDDTRIVRQLHTLFFLSMENCLQEMGKEVPKTGWKIGGDRCYTEANIIKDEEARPGRPE